ncbi:hypothetical protein [Glutamicibacter sp. V16R2B1]|uniref:hypothetical protein n=1 Tax=Glutamicibacter sp. V16R2B1 TaxID=2036207 RepID=UPI0010FE8E63|nr:hypothetical protein [Glutamicibacter sp. V16R2B1]MCK9901265.1 hypothetical protein [Frankia sp. Cpl3]TLK46300.1 hypothetical protein FDN03_16285 [Glutamicibacter sp. V16R2B1]
MTTASDGWRSGYQAAVARLLVTQGEVPETNPSRYGDGVDYNATYDLNEHAKTCTVWQLTREAHETSRSQYDGTDAGSSRIYVIAAGVSCGCGRYVDQPVHLKNRTLSQITISVLNGKG